MAIPQGFGDDPGGPEGVIGIPRASLPNVSMIKEGVSETAEQEALLRALAKRPCALGVFHVRPHRNYIKTPKWAAYVMSRTIQESEGAPLVVVGKTARNIEVWMDNGAQERRLRQIVYNKKAHKRGSAAQAWIKGRMRGGGKFLTAPPKTLKRFPRRQGVLMSKVRANRFTQRKWHLNIINKRDD